MPQVLEKTRELNYPQDKFIFCKDEFVCIKGTFGCGKSLAGLIAANMECEQYPGNLYIVIRKEYIDLKNSTMRDWDSEFGDKYPIVGNEVRYPNGSLMLFLHGEDINSIKNINAGGVLMIQAEEMSEDDFWFLKGRLRRKEGTRQLRLECNYDGHNWIYKLFDINKLGTLITTNTFDNQENLPPDYIPGLMKLPQKLQERYLYGSDAEMEGAIWPMFTERDHIVEPFTIPKHWHKFTSSDTPVASGVLATLWFAVDEAENCYVYNEYYAESRLISEHCQSLHLITGDDFIPEWYADTSAFNKTREKEGQLYSIADEFRDYGITLLKAEKDVYAGINRVGEYFQQGRLKVLRNCPKLIESIPQYRWADLKPTTKGEQKLVPYRVDTHIVEALRYGIMSRPFASILDTTPKVEYHSAEWFERRLKQENKSNVSLNI